jgi:hypothetical protein
MRPLIPLVALGVGVGLFLASSGASGKQKPAPVPPSPTLAEKVRALLASKGFEPLPAFVMTVGVDAVSLIPLAQGAATALSWADAHKNASHSVVVPTQFVDGKTYPYGGAGLPTNVLAIAPADAKSLIDSGLYVEYVR